MTVLRRTFLPNDSPDDCFVVMSPPRNDRPTWNSKPIIPTS